MLYLNFKLNFAFNGSVCCAKEPQFKWPPITFHVLSHTCSTRSSQTMCCLQHSVMLLAESFEMRKHLFNPFRGRAEIKRQSSFEKLWAVCLWRHTLSY